MAAFTNMATLTYNGTTVNSNVVTGEIRQTLTAAKTAVRETYGPGDMVTYVVTLVNTGAAGYTGLTIADDLGQYTAGAQQVYPLTYTTGAIRYYINGALQAQPTVTAEQPLTVTGIDVPAGGSTVLVYETTVNAYAPLDTGAAITNTVTVTGPGITETLTASETVQVRDEALLTVNKALSPTVVPENGQITYTFTIENYGNTAVDAQSDAVLTDIFNPSLTIQTVTYEGDAWTQGTEYTYDTFTGSFATVQGKLLVPAATYTQNADGTVTVEPGTGTLIVTGTIQ